MRWFLSIAIVLGFAVAAPARVLAAPPPYYPSVDWIPAARGNYDVGRAAQITTIVIHETGGSYTSAIHWFQNPASLTSAHYLVKAWDGGIIQFVAESDTAYHARSANPYTIGIEHEFDWRYGIWHTEAQYRASALLVCAIARRYNIPLDRDHIVGHNELPDNNHRDPAAALPAGDESGDVATLQAMLGQLGYMDLVTGYYGDITTSAVARFEQDNGIDSDGSYGPVTRMALATRAR